MKDNDTQINAFQGIPTAWDYVPYADLYYLSVRKLTLAEYGKHATTLDATRAMNMHGNIQFFEWFPDLFNTTKKELGRFWQPQFRLANNCPYADYLHGLTHIRSRTEHTNMGEALVVPDNFWTIGIQYIVYSNTNKDKTLEDCEKTPYEEFQLSKIKIPYQKLAPINVQRFTLIFYYLESDFYKKLYKEGLFIADFPKEKVSSRFLKQPLNSFEERLSHNLVRAIYMDEKYKMFSSTQTPFIHTPVSVSQKESYEIVFSNEEEDHWIAKIAALVRQENPKSAFQQIVNTTGSHSSPAEQLAANTVRELEEYFF